MAFPAMTTLDGLDESHYMLLHMVYLYSEAGGRGENRWVRETPLLVLMYEGITKDVFGALSLACCSLLAQMCSIFPLV
jgi:hypothetical protein